MISVGSKRKVSQMYYRTARNEIRKLAFRSLHKNKSLMRLWCSEQIKRVTGLEPVALSLGS